MDHGLSKVIPAGLNVMSAAPEAFTVNATYLLGNVRNASPKDQLKISYKIIPITTLIAV
jgi:hypothetical protein